MSPIIMTPYLTSIRQAEKDEIKAAMRTGQIVQLHGPPMVGKSVLIEQVIDEMQTNGTSNNVVHYSIDCKALKSFTEFLQRTFLSQESTSANNLTSARGLTSTLVLDKIRSVLKADPSRRHIFVFHKCEALRMSGNDHEFLKFLDCISRLSASENIKVNVIFTSNVKFPTTGRDIEDVHLRMLTDDLDVESLLRHYSQCKSAMVNHVRICQRVLAFPAGIIQFSKTFLNTASTHSAQSLIPLITSDPEFLSSIFQRKLEEATRMRWLDDRDLAFIARCRPVFLRTYTQEMLHEMLGPQVSTMERERYLRRLRERHVLVDTHDLNRLIFHPLVTYLCMTYSGSLRYGIRQNQSSLLTRSDGNMNITGRDLQYFSHWSEIRTLLHKAVPQPRDGSLDALCKVGVTAGKVIIVVFAEKDASHLYNNLMKYSTRLEASKDLDLVLDWQLAESFLDSKLALKKKSQLHFFKWTAIQEVYEMLQRQDYNEKIIDEVDKENESLQHFTETEDDNNNTATEYHVTDSMSDYHCPQICTESPVDDLYSLFDTLHDTQTDDSHQCPSQRIKPNQVEDTDLRKALKCYKKSLELRRYTGDITPYIMCVPLDNLSSLLFQLSQGGSLTDDHLHKALEILSETNWHFCDQVLTLDPITRKHKYFQAFECLLQALSSLTERNQFDDYTSTFLLDLAHLRFVMEDVSQTGVGAPHLNKSAEDFLQDIVSIRESPPHAGFDFHSNYLSACVHGMVLHLRNSKREFDKYHSYFKDYRTYVKNHKLIKTETKHSILSKYNKLSKYVKKQNFQSININKFHDCVAAVCYRCPMLRQHAETSRRPQALREDCNSRKTLPSISSERTLSSDGSETCLGASVSNSSEAEEKIEDMLMLGDEFVINPSTMATSVIIALNSSTIESDSFSGISSISDGRETISVCNPSIND
ncbi:hypothetical protein BgiMline_028300 [Biomphalaria glabrata]|uniref:Uncharacterized protein LOC106075739 n=1 Tax=Biomphalaria glabrata TaxID=6526 RepID=A0A9W2YGV5_BIOGL|nr:uncharacterized protein LOC106075739 [Biomphalaria glabrata]XP_055861957.1 uncharacterized protein LOC106075739 [Biomphalaria glabrata]KAI8753553.1 hypothetical protein BgiMline_014108 [Biomphalaria glabrata]